MVTRTVLDVFKGDAFSTTALDTMISTAPFVPSMLGGMGLFANEPLPPYTTTIQVYAEDGIVSLVPTTKRGAPDVQAKRASGKLYAFEPPRLSVKDSVHSWELPGYAGNFNEAQATRTAVALLDRRTEVLKSNLEATKEYHRLGALGGRLLDADGTTVIYDYAAEFGIAAPAPINIAFGSIAEGDLMPFIMTNFTLPMQKALKNRWVPGSTRLGALCGEQFWLKLLSHPGVRKAYDIQMNNRSVTLAANPNANPPMYEAVVFGGVEWRYYAASYGGDIGTSIGIAASQARFFPINAQDVFKVYWAPGETFQQIAEEGKPDYLMIQWDPREELASHVDVFARCYPLYFCRTPEALMTGTAV